MADSKRLEIERRGYLRLDTVFPVQFRIESPDGKIFHTGWIQGFTNNIGKGGLCLSASNLDTETAKLLSEKQVRVSLEIEIPILKKPVKAIARVAWVKHALIAHSRYLIGLEYETINARHNALITMYSRAKKMFVPLVLAALVLLGAAVAFNLYLNARLIKGNKALVNQLVNIAQESSIAKQKVKQIAKEREELATRIHLLEMRLKTLVEGTVISDVKKIEEQNRLIEQLKDEKVQLEKQLQAIQEKESFVTEELLHLDKRKAVLEEESFSKMYQWLKSHQNQRTGLVMSFEGDTGVEGWAFIYDQSLVAQAYTHFLDFGRAQKIFDFFLREAKREQGLFFNAYYASDGNPAEYSVHSGPNIWLGIAILHYTKKSNDTRYLGLAQEIAQQIIKLQDTEGGIPGGPGLPWYSTEHNLDGYAFFSMLYEITKEARYQEIAQQILLWLKNNTYAAGELPVKRGKGDSTIATDTYAWSIAALGPETLEGIGMNPDRIIEFAEQKCAVEVRYTRPEGSTITVKGFDFAPQQNLGRGSVVSSEWTAQMIIAYKIMARLFEQRGLVAKSRSYALKADEYLMSLVNMVISSPSPFGQGEGCIPYATQDFIDTGHGWMTPKGKNTGSVSGTAYTIFAYYNYNPLRLED